LGTVVTKSPESLFNKICSHFLAFGVSQMKTAALAASFFALVCAAASVPATAATIYTSGTTTGNFNAWNISGNFVVTDQFTLSAGADVTSISFDVWLFPGGSLDSVDWGFGLARYGTGVASGTDATTTGTLLGENKFGLDVYKETISIPGTLLGDKTYWLTLGGADTDNSNPVFWDENDGTSNGYQLGTGSIGAYDCSTLGDCGLSGGETFTLKGIEAPPVPEPSSFLLLGSGLAGFAGLLRRKLKA